jgi:hypothetical protein
MGHIADNTNAVNLSLALAFWYVLKVSFWKQPWCFVWGYLCSHKHFSWNLMVLPEWGPREVCYGFSKAMMHMCRYRRWKYSDWFSAILSGQISDPSHSSVSHSLVGSSVSDFPSHFPCWQQSQWSNIAWWLSDLDIILHMALILI